MISLCQSGIARNSPFWFCAPQRPNLRSSAKSADNPEPPRSAGLRPAATPTSPSPVSYSQPSLRSFPILTSNSWLLLNKLLKNVADLCAVALAEADLSRECGIIDLTRQNITSFQKLLFARRIKNCPNPEKS